MSSVPGLAATGAKAFDAIAPGIFLKIRNGGEGGMNKCLGRGV